MVAVQVYIHHICEAQATSTKHELFYFDSFTGCKAKQKRNQQQTKLAIG